MSLVAIGSPPCEIDDLNHAVRCALVDTPNATPLTDRATLLAALLPRLEGMHVVRCMQAETAVPVHRLYQSKKSTQGARASSSASSSNHQGDYFPPRQDGRSFAARPTCGGDGLLFATEGIGLCLEHRWAEYLTIIATGSFVPRVVWTASPTHRCPQPGFGRERRQGHVSRLSSSTSTRRTTRTSIDVLCLDRGVRICFGFLVHPAPSSDAPISARGSSVHGGSSQ